MFFKSFLFLVLVIHITNCIKNDSQSKLITENKRNVFSGYWNSREFKHQLLNEKHRVSRLNKQRDKLLKQKDEIQTKIFKDRLLPHVSGTIFKDFLTMRYLY